MSEKPTAATIVQPAPKNSSDGRGCNSEAAFHSNRQRLFDLASGIEERAQFGYAKYRQWLRPNNGRSMAIDAYQEALDLCVYLAGEMLEGGEEAKSDFLAALALAERIRPRAEKEFEKRYAKRLAKGEVKS